MLALRAPVACLGITLQEDGYHVLPGENIQEALNLAAKNSTNKTVKVHAGVYRPDTARQALVWFNRAHDGVRLEALGEVTLTAANAELSDAKNSAHPAVVNHVVYFGDGLSPRTVLHGFKITGANHFVTTAPPEIEPNAALEKSLFFTPTAGRSKFSDALIRHFAIWRSRTITPARARRESPFSTKATVTARVPAG